MLKSKRSKDLMQDLVESLVEPLRGWVALYELFGLRRKTAKRSKKINFVVRSDPLADVSQAKCGLILEAISAKVFTGRLVQSTSFYCPTNLTCEHAGRTD